MDVDLAEEDVDSAEGEESLDAVGTVVGIGGVSTFFSVSTRLKSR